MIHCLSLLAQAGHGKSTAAKYLVEKYDARIVSLAGPLKRVCKSVMNFRDEQLYGTQAQKEALDVRYGFSARDFMRKLGTEGLRQHFWPTIHIDALMRDLHALDDEIPYDQLYVVDDLRFKNEGTYLGTPTPLVPRDFHSAVLKLICTDAPPVKTEHASETEVDQVPPEDIAGTVVSSRAQGIGHLCAELDRVIAESSRLAPFRRLLKEGVERVSRRTAEGRAA